MSNLCILRFQVVSAAIAATAVLALTCACSASAPPVAKPVAPKFATPGTATFTVGLPATFNVLTSDRKAKITESGKIPLGLTIHSKPGGFVLSGTPTGPGGKYVLRFTARNAAGSTSQQFVLALEQVPSFSKGYPDSIYGVMLKYDSTPIKATGYPLPTITEQGTLPSGLSFHSFPDGTALISGTPSSFGSSGDSTITLTATNAAGSTTETMSVTTVNAWEVGSLGIGIAVAIFG